MKMLPESSVGRKIIMAITGQGLVLFIIFHMMGNSTIYVNWLNAYAEYLHRLPPLVWVFRMLILVLFSLHILTGISLYLENRAAKPRAYAIRETQRATFASRNMIWTGLIVGSFLVYHLLHFTVQVTNPDISAQMNTDAMGRPDVFMMVVSSFQNVFISVIYVFALTGLFLHLTHGIQSSFQTLGLNNDAALPVIVRTGAVIAFILFLGYISIPVAVYLGIVKG